MPSKLENSHPTRVDSDSFRSHRHSASRLVAPRPIGCASGWAGQVRKWTLPRPVSTRCELLDLTRRRDRRKTTTAGADTEAPTTTRRTKGPSSEEPAPNAKHATSITAASSPQMSTAKRTPPPRHRGAPAGGATTGSSSKEPSPTPRCPKDERNTLTIGIANVDRAVDVATDRDPVTFRERSRKRKHLKKI